MPSRSVVEEEAKLLSPAMKPVLASLTKRIEEGERSW
jgi:hypothetical protein